MTHLVEHSSDFPKYLYFYTLSMSYWSTPYFRLQSVILSPQTPQCHQHLSCYLFFPHLVNLDGCYYQGPHWRRTQHTQFPEKVNVWVWIVLNNIISPFLINDILNDGNFLALL